jgi:hypothetical protein
MWGRKREAVEQAAPADTPGRPLKDAMRQVRIESAERAGVVVELRDAELARLDMLNEALEPLFAEIPPEVELFDRGISRGDTPRLWIDVVAHVDMGRDKRRYRFLQDSRYGRKVLAESTEIPAMAEAITHYVASRMIERERALAADEGGALSERMRQDVHATRRRRRWRMLRTFLFGLILGGIAVLATLWYVASQLSH